MKATHKATKIIVGLQEITLEPGQFIYGREKAANELKMREKVLRNRMIILEKAGNVAIKRANKFSLISIINWNIYQSDDFEKGQQKGQQRANKGPAGTYRNDNIKGGFEAEDFSKRATYKKTRIKTKTIYAREALVEFDLFWKEYPNRVAKVAAEKAWNKNGRPPLDIIIKAIEKQKAWRKNANGKFRPEWKHPSTWLNQKCWEDETDDEKSTNTPFT
jgi:hypothetical protein